MDQTAAFLSQNWNVFAASLLVRGLYKLGVRAFFVSPGYRDAPLLAAIAAHPDLLIRSCWDERAAGYEALGYAKAAKKPAVLICTSGTAAANYYPAVIEAKVDQIPLLIITADRPFELIFAGAQQVIDQRGLFGQYAKRSLDFPAPSPSLDVGAWLSYLRLLVDCSMQQQPGPVHLNLPFHAPLDPIEIAERPSPVLLERAEQALQKLTPSRLETLPAGLPEPMRRQWLEDLRRAERGLLILGRTQSHGQQLALKALAKKLAWPCLVDVGSGLKGQLTQELADPSHPSLARALLDYRPDVCVHFGRRTVSNFIDGYLAKVEPNKYWVFTDSDAVQDPSHLTQRQQLSVDLASLDADWIDWAPVTSSKQKQLFEISARIRVRLSPSPSQAFCFADVAQVIAAHIPSLDHGLFLGNSLAIRAFDSWCDCSQANLPKLEANRGVSGIEGLLSTSLGLALGSAHAWTTVLGDVSMIHDLNALLAVPAAAAPIIIVLVNNAGGRIFDTLPIEAHSWVKDPLMTTPHKFQFRGLAEMAGVRYQLCQTRKEFASAYQEALQSGGSILIECLQDPGVEQSFTQKWKKEE